MTLARALSAAVPAAVPAAVSAALALAAGATLAHATPAHEAPEYRGYTRIYSSVVAIDAPARMLVLADRSRVVAGPSMDLAAVPLNRQVAILARGDEDGFEPARAVIATE